MNEAGAFLEQSQRLGLSLAIGFLVGVERGWKQRSERHGEVEWAAEFLIDD